MKTLLKNLRENNNPPRRLFTMAGTSPNLAGIEHTLSKFFGRKKFEFKQVSKNPETYHVYADRHRVDGISVMKKGNSFRIETEY
jgi:hypothetical protein